MADPNTVIAGYRPDLPFAHAIAGDGKTQMPVVHVANPSGGGGGSGPGGGLTNDELRATPVSVLVATSDTPKPIAYNKASAAGNIAAGKTMISLKNTGEANGKINTIDFPAGEAITFEAQAGSTLGTIAYDATGTTFLIATVG